MELWDAYDRDGRKTGEVLRRGDPIPPGRYHLVAEVLLRHRDGTYLVMRRDPEKPYCPDMWEATAGGSALMGETAEQAARRETLEETGMTVSALRQIYREVGDSYLFEYFAAETDCDKTAVTLQEGETTAYRWISAAELREWIASDRVMHARMLRSAEEL